MCLFHTLYKFIRSLILFYLLVLLRLPIAFYFWNMCDQVTSSVWADNILCYSNNCHNNECQCSPGYQHDMITYRHRDCRQPILFYQIAGALNITFSLLGVVSIAKFIPNSKRLARKIVLAALAVSALNGLVEIALFAQGHINRTASLLLSLLNISAISLLTSLVSYSLASPLYIISRTSPERTQKQLISSFTFFRALTIIDCVYAIVKFEDPSNPTNDYQWNICIAIFYYLTAIELVVVLGSSIYNAFQMIKTIESISSSGLVADNKLKTEYLPKVKSILNGSRTAGLLISLTIVICPTIELATGYIPGNFAIYYVQQISLPTFALSSASFATSKKLQVDSITTSKSEPNKVEVLKTGEFGVVNAQAQQQTSISPSQ